MHKYKSLKDAKNKLWLGMPSVWPFNLHQLKKVQFDNITKIQMLPLPASFPRPEGMASLATFTPFPFI